MLNQGRRWWVVSKNLILNQGAGKVRKLIILLIQNICPFLIG